MILTSSGRWALLVGLTSIGAGQIFGYRFLTVIGLTMLLAIFSGLLWVLRRPRLSAYQRLLPSVVEQGEEASAVVTTTNIGTRRSPRLVASDVIGDRRRAVPIAELNPNESSRTVIPLPTDRRGHFPVGPLDIERTDPLGLFRMTTHSGAEVKLVVHPLIHKMTTLPTGHRRELEGSASERPQEGGISFHSLRDYIAGDDLRLIHWRSVAKTGALMVRKNIITSEPRLMVLLDTWSGSYVDADFEDAVRVAASLVDAGCASRYPVSFHTTGGYGAEANSSGEGRLAIMRILAGVQHSKNDPGLNGVLRVAGRVEGVSLGAVTGQPPAERTIGITRVQPRFDMVTVVQVGASFDRPPMRIPGAFVINGADSLDVAARWRTQFG